MTGHLFLHGLIIGFSIAAPVGPIGVLCIRRTLEQGRWVGFLSGLGAATADAIYGCVAGFGLTVVATALVEQAFWFRLVGGLFLCYLGLKTILWRSPPPNLKAPSPKTALNSPSIAAADNSANDAFTLARGKAFLVAYTSTIALTLTNPATILSFAAIFSGLGLANIDRSYGSAMILVGGVFSGSALWWLMLSYGANLFRGLATPPRLRWLNRGSGAILLAFGLIAIFNSV